MMALTSVLDEIETSVVCEMPNVAISFDPLGTASGVQFTGVFQSPEVGSKSHWALVPWAMIGTRNITKQRIAAAMSVFIQVISEVSPMREITASRSLPLGKPSSPRTSRSEDRRQKRELESSAKHPIEVISHSLRESTGLCFLKIAHSPRL